MSKSSHKQIIDKLAASYGIEPEYMDNWGRVQQTPAETKLNILRAMGVNVDTKARANKARHSRQEVEWSCMMEPAIVATLSGLPKDLVFQIPASASSGKATEDLEASLEVTDEHGMARHLAFTHKDLSFCESGRAGNMTCEHWSLPFPRLQNIGYYRFYLSVRTGGGGQEWSQAIFVAICPEKAYIPPSLQGNGRAAGIAISLYGVRSKRNWGVGDFGDLKKILDWVAEDLHGGIVGLNPLHAIFNRKPFNTSPYLPMSRFYRNFIYLDITVIEDYRDSPKARGLVDTSKTQRLLSELRDSKMVQYEQIAALKQKVLKEVFQTFLENHWNRTGSKTDRQREFEEYIEREGHLLDNFATFCALDSAIRSKDPEAWTWSQWPREYQRPDTKAVRRFREEHWRGILFHKYVQWQLEKQLAQIQDYARSRGMCIGLYHDLALAVDRFSADFWAYQDFFISRLRLGAPPDAFSQHGQDWGFPLPDMKKIRENSYDLFVKEIQKSCAFGGALRIDHVMRFFHLYCIPEGEPPKKGAYVSQSFKDLIRIVALESVRNQVVVIGEDLGTVPGYIRDILGKANIFSYRLLYFEKDDQKGFIPPQDYPELALVAVATHDLPTLAGFWTHRDIKIRKEAGMFDSREAVVNAASEREIDKHNLLKLLQDLKLLPEHYPCDPRAYPGVTGELHNAIVGFLALTPAKLFILSQEDLFKGRDQQNLPGTTVEYPNWSLKMEYTVEQLRSDSKARTFSDMFQNWIKRSGRNNPTVWRYAMSEKKDKTKSSLRTESSGESGKIKFGKEKTERIKRNGRPREEKMLERMQRARVKEVHRKILRDETYNKHKKADKKIGGVRGKFHPSLERTRKRT
ncbi:MAG: 4-alpha-glucanotransferase [Desulfobacterales bacterium]|nr:4-alpha-glucanotransferase [Desulfobacterales bacterium]